MKNFYPTYLYVKTHNITGLKYFGKTTGDPFKYRGSGKRWLAHIKKNGYNVTTEVLGYFENEIECTKAALNFSKINQIVESTDWANMIDENGVDGGAIPRKYFSMTEETKKKLSNSLTGKPAWNKGITNPTSGNRLPRTSEQKLKISNSLKGRKRSAESISKTANALRGRKRPEVGEKLKGRKKSPETIQKMKLAQQNKPPVSEDTKEKISKARKNQIFTEATKKKLSGKVIVVDKNGNIKKIPKEEYYSQTGDKSDWEYVAHNSSIGKLRLNKQLTSLV